MGTQGAGSHGCEEFVGTREVVKKSFETSFRLQKMVGGDQVSISPDSQKTNNQKLF